MYCIYTIFQNERKTALEASRIPFRGQRYFISPEKEKKLGFLAKTKNIQI